MLIYPRYPVIIIIGLAAAKLHINVYRAAKNEKYFKTG